MDSPSCLMSFEPSLNTSAIAGPGRSVEVASKAQSAAANEEAMQNLRRLTREAQQRAYAPYSRFKVGAALMTDTGKTFAGCNVENASYGLTICAERNAVFQAVAAGETRIQKVVIFTDADGPTPPCGACRQVINEFGPDAEVIAFSSSGEEKRWRMNELLPGAFGPDNISAARK